MWLAVGGIKWRVDVAETIWVNIGKKPHCSKAARVKHDFGGRCWLPTLNTVRSVLPFKTCLEIVLLDLFSPIKLDSTNTNV